MQSKLPVAVVGAGPVGMAAAAHLIKRNIPFILFESGSDVGGNITSWAHVNMFSPWKYNLDKAAKELLVAAAWEHPPDDQVHNGQEFLDLYLRPLASLPEMKPHIHLNSKVVAIGRKNMDKMKDKNRENVPFVIRVKQDEEYTLFEAKAVIDASGSWLNPNPLGSGGNFAIGELENASHIFYGIPDASKNFEDHYSNQKIAVIGAGHSAINTIFELEKIKDKFPETEINWVLRKQNLKDVYGGQADDQLAARGELGIKIEQLVTSGEVNVYMPFQIEEVRKVGSKLALIGYQNDRRAMLPPIDEIICNTGSRPDFSFLGEVRLSISSSVESSVAIADLIDPNLHSCGSVRPHGELELKHAEKGFYIVGVKSYGRAPTFLMATGYEQVRSVVAALDGDMEAARNVELELPETGVCNSGGGEGACCA